MIAGSKHREESKKKMSKSKTKPVLARFWKSVSKLPSGCWVWTGYIGKSGYGYLGVNRRMMRVHRYSWILHRGKIKGGLNVLHKCDNPSCVNPDHLFLGTQQDNVDDMIAKGRRAPRTGTNNGQSKLDEQLVRELRKDRELGMHVQQLSIKYGVIVSCVYKIISRRSWSHVE